MDYDYWRSFARAFAQSLGLKGDDLDDAEQEGALKAFEQEGMDDPWVAVCIKNTIKDFYKKRIRIMEHEVPLGDYPVLDNEISPEVQELLEAMPEDIWIIVTMRAEGRPWKDVATAIGTTEATAKVRMERYRKKLKKLD